MSEPISSNLDPLTIARGLMTSRVLLTAVELRVFDQIEQGHRTADELALAMATEPRATERLLNALAGMGLLTKDDDGRFGNTVESWRFLVSESIECMIGPLRHYAYLWQSWSTLTEVVRTGRPVPRPADAAMDADRTEASMAAMERFASDRAPEVAKLLDLSEAESMLDIGGGPATYSIAFCRRYQELKATLFDLPEVIPVARERIADARLSHRITTQAGDYHTDDFDTGYDFALLSQILHSNSVVQNRALLAKAFNALAPGGAVLIQEFLTDDSKTAPPSAALFGINMLVGTALGDVFSENQVLEWLTDIGFVEARRLEGVPEADGLVAWKPNEA